MPSARGLDGNRLLGNSQMSVGLEVTAVSIFAVGVVGLLWAPTIALTVRGRNREPAASRSIFRIWATFGIVGVALAVIAFLIVTALPK